MSSGHGPPCSPASEPNRSFCSQSGSSAASDRPVCSSVTLSVLDAETRVTRDISSLERSSWCRGRVSICFHAERDECPRVDSHRDPLSDTHRPESYRHWIWLKPWPSFHMSAVSRHLCPKRVSPLHLPLPRVAAEDARAQGPESSFGGLNVIKNNNKKGRCFKFFTVYFFFDNNQKTTKRKIKIKPL